MATKNLNDALKFGQILNKPSKNYQKPLKIWQKWRNFAKSVHTGHPRTNSIVMQQFPGIDVVTEN